MELLSEPTAAAISYGFKPDSDDVKTILVYDFGGGTFDASLIVSAGTQFIEQGKAGDLWLGGDDVDRLEEVRIKVFLPRLDPRCPSVYWIWKTADWQERETFDMYGIIYEGHPNLKRILMPEDWIGYPMRKDYVTPDFYELQDAY